MSDVVFETKDITFSYGGRPALTALTTAVSPGTIGLLGPNGAGKTTYIRTLLGLTNPQSGSATVLGFDARRDAPLIRQRVGYMPENECYFADQSGLEAVIYAARLSGLPRNAAIQRAHEMLDFAGIDEARYRGTQGYSTGMKQRVKLAQALVHGPELLFLDEPTNGLDPKGRDDMLDLIAGLGAASVSVVLSTHILNDVERVCSDVLLLAGGQLKHYGPLSAFTAGASGEWIVHVKEGRGLLMDSLTRAGLVPFGAEPDAPLQFRLRLEAQQVLTFWQVVTTTGVQVREFAPEQLSLETALMRFLGAAA